MPDFTKAPEQDLAEPPKPRTRLPIIMGGSARDRVMWFEKVSQADMDAQHARNHKRIKDAEKAKADKSRPLEMVLISNSGRADNAKSCAHARSRSSMALDWTAELLETAAPGIVLTRLDMWELNVEHCNGHYGTEDYWCQYPCTCWPFDDGIVLYEQFARCDAAIIATPVNEASAASRFWQWWHRMICTDGGLDFKPPPGWAKTYEALEQMRKERGKHKGLTYEPRFRDIPFGIIALGHELGATMTAATIAQSVQFRGGYVPQNCSVPKIYRGAGPNAKDEEVIAGRNDFTKELAGELAVMAEQLVVDAKANRSKPMVPYSGDRT